MKITHHPVEADLRLSWVFRLRMSVDGVRGGQLNVISAVTHQAVTARQMGSIRFASERDPQNEETKATIFFAMPCRKSINEKMKTMMTPHPL